MVSHAGRFPVLVLVVVALFTACGSSEDDSTGRDGSGAIVESGEIDAFAVQVGDCIADTEGEEIRSVEGVPCTGEHAAEAYHAFDVTSEDGSYPGLDAVMAEAETGCLDAFATFVGVDYLASTAYGIDWFAPTEQTWDQLDDREVLCLVFNIDGSLKTGSAEGTAT